MKLKGELLCPGVFSFIVSLFLYVKFMLLASMYITKRSFHAVLACLHTIDPVLPFVPLHSFCRIFRFWFWFRTNEQTYKQTKKRGRNQNQNRKIRQNECKGTNGSTGSMHDFFFIFFQLVCLYVCSFVPLGFCLLLSLLTLVSLFSSCVFINSERMM